MRWMTVGIGIVVLAVLAGTGASRDLPAGISSPTGQYELQFIWESPFGLPFQIARLPNGDLILAEDRLVRLTGDQVQVLATAPQADAHGGISYVTVLPNGHAVYLLNNRLWSVDPDDAGEARPFASPPTGVELTGPLASDGDGNVYVGVRGISVHRRSPSGDWERLASGLPFPDPGWNPLNDMVVAQDGTVYVAGYTRVVRVRPDGTVEVIADGLNYEPVWVDLSPDGTLYINDLAYQLQRYDPRTGRLTQLEVRSGFSDFEVISTHEIVFYDFTGIYYRLDLNSHEIEPLFVKKSGNSMAFAADGTGGLFFATPAMPPTLKAHMVHLRSDGPSEDMPALSYDEIHSADVDDLNRLNLLTDEGIVRVEEDGSVYRLPVNLPSGNLAIRGFAATAHNGWYLATSNFQDAAQLYKVDAFGFLYPLPIRFDQASFSGVFTVDDVRVDVEADGNIVLIATAKGSAAEGPYHQRVFRATPNGGALTEIANLDCQRMAGMVDIAAGPAGDVFVLAVVHDPIEFGWDSVFRIDRRGNVSEVVRVAAGRDPKSIDVDDQGNIWLGTTLGVFRALPRDGH